MSRPLVSKLVLLALTAAGVIATGVYAWWTAVEDPHASLDTTQLAPEWWTRGECEDCHLPDDDGATAAPQFHDEQFRRYTHGRTEALTPDRCQHCHAIDGCRACHARQPPSHTSGFRVPAAGDQQARRHAILARLRPSACMACHSSFVPGCTNCHSAAEAQNWAETAREELVRWPMLRPAAVEGEAP